MAAKQRDNDMIKEKSGIVRKGGHMDLSDRLLYATLLAVSYPLCLMAASTTRLTGIFGDEAIGTTESIFSEAKSAAHAAVGYAFHV